jgi:hypothetical protein
MSSGATRQTAKVSSLEAARTFFLVIVGLAVRQALLFLLDPTFRLQQPLRFWVSIVVTSGFLFTAFRFSHGVAVVYEFEKEAAKTTTTPSSKKVEQIFALFALEGVFLFLMSERLGEPHLLALFSVGLLVSDLLYISVSKTIKDASLGRLVAPSYWLRRWSLTEHGTAPRTHLQWAISDVLLGLLLLATMFRRPLLMENATFGDYKADWSFAIAGFLILAGVADYKTNYEFYFGRIQYKQRKCVFICSKLKPPSGLEAEASKRHIAENIRRAQWYCREIYLSGASIPYASHGFYPYFLDDGSQLERKLGRKCALEYLTHCDAIQLYTPGASQDPKHLSQGMTQEFEYAKRHGLEIRYLPIDEPDPNFRPVWAPLNYAPLDNGTLPPPSEIDLEQDWKKVFLCSSLRPTPNDDRSQAQKVIAGNIRLAHWLCHQLVRGKGEGGKMLAVFAPQAFYPFFTNYDENEGPAWLESAVDILKLCDAIYVYTRDGLENEAFITAGMRECIIHARALGLEMKFRKIEEPPAEWKPCTWQPALIEVPAKRH